MSPAPRTLPAPSRLSCEPCGSPAALLQLLQHSSSSCSSLWAQPFPLSGSTGPAPQWPGCAAMPQAGTLQLPSQVPAWQQGVPGICLSCSTSAVLAIEFKSLCIPRAALQVREEELLLPGATLHQHSPSVPSGQIPTLCLPAAGRELPPLPGSSCLSCISGSLPAATWIHFSEQ